MSTESSEHAEIQGHEETGDPYHSMPGRDRRQGSLTFEGKAKLEMVLAEKSKNTRKLPPGQVVPLDEKEVQLDMRTLTPAGAIDQRCWYGNDFYSHTSG